MNDQTESTNNIGCWVGIGLLLIAVGFCTFKAVSIIGKRIASTQETKRWPSVKGKAGWNGYRTQKTVEVRKDMYEYTVDCRYTYKVENKTYSGSNFTLFRFTKVLGTKELNECLSPALEGKTNRRNRKLDWNIALQEMATAYGKSYEDENGYVTVYYNPSDHAQSILETELKLKEFALPTLWLFPMFILMYVIIRRYLGRGRKKERYCQLPAKSGKQKSHSPHPQEPLITDCPYCEEEFEVSPELLGQVVECPHCQEHLTLPTG